MSNWASRTAAFETPGYIGGVESTRYGYGRVTQQHLDAAGWHVDGLVG